MSYFSSSSSFRRRPRCARACYTRPRWSSCARGVYQPMAIGFRCFAEGQFESRPNLDCDLLHSVAAAVALSVGCRVRGCVALLAAGPRSRMCTCCCRFFENLVDSYPQCQTCIISLMGHRQQRRKVCPEARLSKERSAMRLFVQCLQ